MQVISQVLAPCEFFLINALLLSLHIYNCYFGFTVYYTDITDITFLAKLSQLRFSISCFYRDLLASTLVQSSEYCY